MNQHDLMKAIRELPDETVEKYALPKRENSGLLHQDNAAGKENIVMTDTTAEKKSPIRAHRAGIAAAILLCLGMNAGLIFGISRMNRTMDAHSPVESIADYKMPDLMGMDYDGSKMMYGDVIQIVVESREYSSFEAGFIFDQDIPPGEPIQKGDTVHVKVSLGTRKVILPDVVGWEFETAKTQLLGLGLYVDKRSSYDDEVPEGKVISTDPEAPVEIEPGSYVRVMVSLGPNKDTVAVPNFVGMTWDTAKTTAEGMGLTVSKRPWYHPETKGLVADQDIEAGKEVIEGTNIELLVGVDNTNETAEFYGTSMEITAPAGVNGFYLITIITEESENEMMAGEEQNSIVVQFTETERTVEIPVSLPYTGEEVLSVTIESNDTHKKAEIGKYRTVMGSQEYETISENIAGAFAQILIPDESSETP